MEREGVGSAKYSKQIHSKYKLTETGFKLHKFLGLALKVSINVEILLTVLKSHKRQDFFVFNF